jgi:trimeric autotransporter adhesin
MTRSGSSSPSRSFTSAASACVSASSSTSLPLYTPIAAQSSLSLSASLALSINNELQSQSQSQSQSLSNSVGATSKPQSAPTLRLPNAKSTLSISAPSSPRESTAPTPSLGRSTISASPTSAPTQLQHHHHQQQHHHHRRAQPPSPTSAQSSPGHTHKRMGSDVLSSVIAGNWDFRLSLGSLSRTTSSSNSASGTTGAEPSALRPDSSPARVRLFEDYPYSDTSATFDFKHRSTSTLVHVPRLAEITAATRSAAQLSTTSHVGSSSAPKSSLPSWFSNVFKSKSKEERDQEQLQSKMVRDYEQHVELIQVWSSEILPKWSVVYVSLSLSLSLSQRTTAVAANTSHPHANRRQHPRTKSLCRNGIPMVMRGDVWMLAIGNNLGVCMPHTHTKRPIV